MRLRIAPGAIHQGEVLVPGDKSIAHRWLILAATARGSSRLDGVPPSLDVRSMAACLAKVAPVAAPSLEAWCQDVAGSGEGHGSTWNGDLHPPVGVTLEVEGEGRDALSEARSGLDCGNSGTTMRLLAGVLAGAPFRSVLVGDESLSDRPMERVAEPLRSMGAIVATSDGHPPLEISGAHLHGISYRPPVPSAQVKGAILLAGLVADGRTEVEEPAPTRDHTERALVALQAPLTVEGRRVAIERFQHEGFQGQVPGDPSTAAFLIAAAGLSGTALTLDGIGLNPTRLGFLSVMRRMGIEAEVLHLKEEVGEPVGQIRVTPTGHLTGTRIAGEELPTVIDEVPILALLAAFASGETRFSEAGELRVKEADRLRGLADGIRELGGRAETESNDLVVEGVGLEGGRADARGDHRLAMAFTVGALAAAAPSEVDGIEAADVSYPGFVKALRALGADLEFAG